MKLNYLLFCAFIVFSFSTQAQEVPKREIGLRTSPANLTNVGFIYKKQLSENTYRRYRLAVGTLGVNVINDNTQVSFNVNGAIGKEKRKPMDEKLSFIYGTELIAGIGLTSISGGTTTIDIGNGSTTTINGSSVTLFTPSVGIGFVLGVMYDIKPKWYLSAEIIPSVTANGTFGSGVSIYGLQANFNSSSVGITGAYRF
ncbi:hypothetical protein ACFSUS_07030 [Spirosoma soli]|uniref:Outer membrane protein beta-barrel domain-containing protein n=1 Tax=Spirosoma soli TaxID=1770529 RepID=A0ABW5M2R5_9BACT